MWSPGVKKHGFVRDKRRRMTAGRVFQGSASIQGPGGWRSSPEDSCGGMKGRPETETVLGGRHLGQNSPKPHPSATLYVLPSFPRTMGSSGLQGRWRDRCFAVWLCLQQWPLLGTLHFSGPHPREAHDRLLSMAPGLARPRWKEWSVSLGGCSSCPSFLVIAQHTVKVKGRQGGLERAGEGLAEHRRAPGECASI